MKLKTKKRKVLVFGTFDTLHKGHIDFFRQARKRRGSDNFLIAIIARDKTVLQVKKRKPLQDERVRLKNVKKHVDKAILGSTGNKYSVIKKIKPDIICLGYDQKSFTKGLRSGLKRQGVNANIIRLRPYKPKIYKSRILRKGNG